MGRRRNGRSGPPGRDTDVEPPTVVSWEVDHSCGFPVVDVSPGVSGVDVLEAERPGMSAEPQLRPAAWADQWETLAMRDVDG
jgi:hypothetical protein